MYSSVWLNDKSILQRVERYFPNSINETKLKNVINEMGCKFTNMHIFYNYTTIVIVNDIHTTCRHFVKRLNSRRF